MQEECKHFTCSDGADVNFIVYPCHLYILDTGHLNPRCCLLSFSGIFIQNDHLLSESHFMLNDLPCSTMVGHWDKTAGVLTKSKFFSFLNTSVVQKIMACSIFSFLPHFPAPVLLREVVQHCCRLCYYISIMK